MVAIETEKLKLKCILKMEVLGSIYKMKYVHLEIGLRKNAKFILTMSRIDINDEIFTDWLSLELGFKCIEDF